ncbi:hypothetical protein ABT294_00860 [Nonomuraea sp. NPDC000554]|uniref:hypothetical protein n=1 Tax=Nonomuraea sp. NPDC000554 TaxID=3154259 RepID=UPI0033212BC7
MSALIDARPQPNEVVIVPIQPGEAVVVYRPEGQRLYRPAVDGAYVAVIPADRKVIGWGWSEGWYGSLTGVRNGHHRLDRDAWHAAASALKRGGVAYVQYVQRDYYGKPRWTANGYRWEPAEQAAAVTA